MEKFEEKTPDGLFTNRMVFVNYVTLKRQT